MQKTDGSITSQYGEGIREDFLFTYDENEARENKINKNNAGLIDNVEFYPLYTEYNGKMSLESKVLMGFFRYRCKNGKKIYKSNEDLAVLLECSPDTVKRRIKELRDLGLLDYSVDHLVGGGSSRLFWLNTTESANCTVQRVQIAPSYNNYIYSKYIDNIDILDDNVIYYAHEIFENFGEDGLEGVLEKYKDVLADFLVYRCECDKKGTPRWKKEKTRSLVGRLARWKKNNDTNFGRNKPVFPLEEIKQAAVSYAVYYKKKPEYAKPYAEFLKKYGVLDNGKWKEYAKMVLGAGFVF